MIFYHISCVAVVLSFKNGARLRFAVHMVISSHIELIIYHSFWNYCSFELIINFTGVEKTKVSPPPSQYMES